MCLCRDDHKRVISRLNDIEQQQLLHRMQQQKNNSLVDSCTNDSSLGIVICPSSNSCESAEITTKPAPTHHPITVEIRTPDNELESSIQPEAAAEATSGATSGATSRALQTPPEATSEAVQTPPEAAPEAVQTPPEAAPKAVQTPLEADNQSAKSKHLEGDSNSNTDDSELPDSFDSDGYVDIATTSQTPCQDLSASSNDWSDLHNLTLQFTPEIQAQFHRKIHYAKQQDPSLHASSVNRLLNDAEQHARQINQSTVEQTTVGQNTLQQELKGLIKVNDALDTVFADGLDTPVGTTTEGNTSDVVDRMLNDNTLTNDMADLENLLTVNSENQDSDD